MKGIGFYYSEFENILSSGNPGVAKEYAQFLNLHAHEPHKVFMWLEEKRISGELPRQMEECLTSFYWEIR